MPTYSTPVKDVIARLNYHTTPGQTPARMLDGWKFEAIPKASVEGMTDLPGIRIYIPDLKGEYHPSRNEKSDITVKLIIGTKRDNGLVDHLEGVEKVMDALNIDTAGNLHPAILGTAKPWSWATGDNFIVDTSLNSEVSIRLEPKVVELGRRRL